MGFSLIWATSGWSMIIQKVFSNNAILALSNGEEVILTGKGIGFQQKPGQDVDESKIEKRYALSYEAKLKFEKILETVPVEYLLLSEEIYNHAQNELGLELHKQLIIDLADHICFAVERSRMVAQENLFFLEDIQEVYPAEYAFSEKAKQWIEQRFEVTLPKEEIGYIAFHIVNSEVGDPSETPKMLMEFVKLVLQQFEECYPKVTEFRNTDSYRRFLVHLRFLGNRVLRKEEFKPYSDEILQKEFASETELLSCMHQINDAVQQQFHYPLSPEEEIYLMIHMKRILKENGLA